MRYIIKNIYLGAFLLLANGAFAQINPLGAQYFQNRYLSNPAMAGAEDGLRLNLGYRLQGGSMPGSPRTTALTTDYRTGKVGLGLSMSKDQSGLLEQTKFVGTYAYHLPLNDGDKHLRFGISLGVLSERLNLQAMEGSMGDQTALQFGDRPSKLDGDFGFAYSDRHLTVEGALNNLREQAGGSDRGYQGNNATFYTAVSYELGLNGFRVVPKVAYRGISHYKDLFDVGLEARLLGNLVGLTAFYHSNDSYTAGFSYEHRQQVRFLFLFTSSTSAVQNYTNNMFEMGLQLNLHNFKKKDR